MKFYSIEPSLAEAIDRGEEGRVRIEIDFSRTGTYTTVREEDILEANFTSQKENAGGISSRGEVLLDNRKGEYTGTDGTNNAGTSVFVSFSVGFGRPFCGRFSFHIDYSGIQEIRGPGRNRQVRLALLDFSFVLRKTDEARDWQSSAVLVYSVICDKAQSNKSLLHRAAARAGLTSADIECPTIPYELPYASLDRNLWAELSDLARTYRAHLETGIGKPLVFSYSPYQNEEATEDESSYRFDHGNLFSLSASSLFTAYRNTIRLKFNRPEVLERQEIWRYRDGPELYDSNMRPYYPFRPNSPRAVSEDGYVARYRVAEAVGTFRDVVYADQIDDFTQARERLTYDGGPIFYNRYDVLSYRDRAVLSLKAGSEANLYNASIHGRPIVLATNTSFYARDESGIERYGTRALNVSSGYFSSDPTSSGKPQYADWAERELAERTRFKHLFIAKTNRTIFHARVGALVTVAIGATETVSIIRAMRLSYRKGKAFVSSFRLEER